MLPKQKKSNGETFRSKLKRFWQSLTFLLNVSLFCAFLIGVAHAGAIAPCAEPFVYENAAVNVIVLPYAYLPAPGQPFHQTGEKLAALVQADTLYSILKFNSIGVVRLYGSPEECDPSNIMKRLLVQGMFNWTTLRGATNDAPNTPGRHGLILVWGTIYEESENIFVQTFVSFRRRDQADPGENVYFKLGTEYLSGRLSSQELSFPPRRITAQDLHRIEDKFATTAVLHTLPKDSSPTVMALVGTDAAPMESWAVLEQSGEWIHLQVRQGRYGPENSGWLHAKIDLGDSPLNSKLPELRYIEGLVGYLRFRILGGEHEMASAAQRAFESYPMATEDDPNPLPSAVAKQLLGFLQLLASEQSQQGLTQAHEEFEQAFHLAPYSAEAGNLELITRASLSFLPGSQPIGSKLFAGDMLRISALDPANSELRDNLAALYTYSERPEVLARVPPDQRLTSVEQIEKINGLKRLKHRSRDDIILARPATDWPIHTVGG